MMLGLRLALVTYAATLVACGPVVDVSSGDTEAGATTDAGPPSSGTADTPSPPPPTSGPVDPGDPPDPTGLPPDPVDPVDTTGPGPDPIDGSTGSTGPFPGTGSSETGDPTGKTTAGSGGDEPGGVGPDAVPDEEGDVTLPGADVLAAAVYTDGTLVDFRVQFADEPFGDETTYSVGWCLDTGAPGGGSCATHATGIDAYLSLFQKGPSGQFVSGTDGVDPCLHTAYEAETRTLRVLVPAEEFPGTWDFRWILTVTFGGSSGNNEWVPENGDLGVVFVDELPAFAGEPSC